MSGARQALGTIKVKALATDAAAFRRATGCDGASDVLPLTFPMRWLALPDARRAIMTLVPEADLVPVHESQSFDYPTTLQASRAYRLELSGERVAAPDRLIIEGAVLGEDGSVQARLETILRLVSIPAAA